LTSCSCVNDVGGFVIIVNFIYVFWADKGPFVRFGYTPAHLPYLSYFSDGMIICQIVPTPFCLSTAVDIPLYRDRVEDPERILSKPDKGEKRRNNSGRYRKQGLLFWLNFTRHSVTMVDSFLYICSLVPKNINEHSGR